MTTIHFKHTALPAPQTPESPNAHVYHPTTLDWATLTPDQKTCWKQAGLVQEMDLDDNTNEEDLQIPLPNISENLLPVIGDIVCHTTWNSNLPNPLIQSQEGTIIPVSAVKKRLNALHYLLALELPHITAMMTHAKTIANKVVTSTLCDTHAQLAPFVTKLSVDFFSLTDIQFAQFLSHNNYDAPTRTPLSLTMGKFHTRDQYSLNMARVDTLRGTPIDVHLTLLLNGRDLAGVQVPDSLVGIQKLQLSGEHNTPDLLSRALADKIPHLQLCACNLANVQTPDSLVGIQSLYIFMPSDIPPTLISRALEAKIPKLDLHHCYFTGAQVPDSLVGIQSLHISSPRDIPPTLISRALEAKIPKLNLTYCHLEGVQVPDSLIGIQYLNLDHARYVPKALISMALEAKIPHIDLGHCYLSDVQVPESLVGIKFLNLRGATNVPPELRARAQEAGAKVVG